MLFSCGRVKTVAPDAPLIRVAEQNISLGELPMTRPVPVRIEVYNDGGTPLRIEEMRTGCSCLRKMGDSRVTVAPRDSVSLLFALAPYAAGDIRQNITLVSNGANDSLLKINIRATFKSELL